MEVRFIVTKTRQLADDRPLPLLLGVLYKLQESLTHSVDGIGRNVEPVALDNKEDVVSLLGHYWQLIRAADSSIRYIDHDLGQDEEENQEDRAARIIKMSKREYATILGIPEEQVVWVWSSKAVEASTSLSKHVPEHMITVDHQQKSVILTLLGTKVFPAPQPLDIIMDLMATVETFLDGIAHGGLSVGTRNLVETAGPVLRRELECRPSYSLLILGYSLGAGLAQLLALDCQLGPCSQSLPRNTNIRTVAFGSPPVFARQREEPPVLDNVFIVQNSEDGISGASLRNVYDVLNKACLVHSLNIKRRNLLKLLFSDLETEEDEQDKELIQFQDDQYDDEAELIDYDQLEMEDNSDITDTWMRIKESLDNYSSKVEEPKLHHLGGTFLVLTKTSEDLIDVENYQGFQGTEMFARELILKGSMISDHMPGAYNYLFEKYQNVNKTQKILSSDLLDRLVNKTEETSFRGKLKEKVKSFLDFFNGIGK